MREDVKKKHFSTSLRETSIDRCLHPGPFFFVERILVRTPGAPQSAPGIRIAVAGLPWVVSGSGPDTPLVAKLRKPTVGLSANHHPMW